MNPRMLSVKQQVIGDAAAVTAALSADPGRWLPRPARRAGSTRWMITLSAGPMRRSVTCHVGVTWRIGSTTLWRSLDWHPRRREQAVLAMERWLPSLRGELGLQVQGDQPTLVLEGVYDPPAGPLGEVVDAAVMHRIATATAQRFLDDVIDQLAPGSRPTGHST